MSPRHKLTVTAADPLAEISVYDGGFKRLGRAVGRLEMELLDGLYELRARMGGASEEKLISLDKDMTVPFGPIAFASAMPLSGTLTQDAAHQAAIQRAMAAPIAPQGLANAGSGLLVFVRDRMRGETRPGLGSPASGLSLIGPDGVQIVDIGAVAPVDATGRAPAAAVFLHVNPGVYRLRLDFPNEGARERTLVASAGWTTQCFLVRRRFREVTVADLDQGAVSLSRLGAAFQPNDQRLRLAEAARDALTNFRSVTAEAYRALLAEKFQDPILGLLVGHLILRDASNDARLPAVLPIVVDNLQRMLGADHPDVRALALGAGLDSRVDPIADMPMLRASWDWIVRRTLTTPGLVPADSLAGQVSTRILPSAPWLVWEPAGSPSRRRDGKMAALRGYLRPPSEPSGSMPPGVQLETTPAAAAGALEPEQRAELATSLGVPGAVLDDMISKLGD